MTEQYRRRHTAALARVAVRLLVDVPTLRVPDAAAAVGVSEYTVYRYWHEAHPGRQPGRRATGPMITEAMRIAQRAYNAHLCDVMHGCLRGELAARELFRRTISAHGSPVADTQVAEDRRLWRALSRLLRDGRVERVGRKMTQESRYRRVANG